MKTKQLSKRYRIRYAEQGESDFVGFVPAEAVRLAFTVLGREGYTVWYHGTAFGKYGKIHWCRELNDCSAGLQ